MLKIAILGTRGIPNNYGGFEQFAEFLSVGLSKRNFDVTVYNSHNHPYQSENWNGVKIVHCYDPEKSIGTAGQFVYDLNCILDTRKRKFDIILQLGYTSNSIWMKLLPKHSVITTNMDGLEWMRSKYPKPVQYFLKFAEKLAVKNSRHLIADSLGIQSYLKTKYNRKSTYIPYGADIFENPDVEILNKFSLIPYSYNLLIARLESENNIEMILEGVALSKNPIPFLVIGNCENNYGKNMRKKFIDHPNILFYGSIYDINILNNLRYFSNLYFHGHTVGGTNPSLLEAMASGSLICAHSNIFNQSVLGGNAYYFENKTDVANLVNGLNKKDKKNTALILLNKEKIQEKYSWRKIIHDYIDHFKEIFLEKRCTEKNNKADYNPFPQHL